MHSSSPVCAWAFFLMSFSSKISKKCLLLVSCRLLIFNSLRSCSLSCYSGSFADYSIFTDFFPRLLGSMSFIVDGEGSLSCELSSSLFELSWMFDRISWMLTLTPCFFLDFMMDLLGWLIFSESKYRPQGLLWESGLTFNIASWPFVSDHAVHI